ncbi:tyrosine-type recombinase/integrase [Kitasatospora sp. NPDC056076]|uniref:tyrosine-type recombinase/integrase n=1 Tax=Kitasatospora sp. NPDC056076 TaxID=3345703 RepID=UPI0035DDB2FC
MADLTTSDLERRATAPAQLAEWEAKYGPDAAARLAAAEEAKRAAQKAMEKGNTTRNRTTAFRTWERYCAWAGTPVEEASGGAVAVWVMWMHRQGKLDGTGMAPGSVQTMLFAAVSELRDRGIKVSRDDVADAKAIATALAVELAQAGEVRGRGQAPAATVEGLHQIAEAAPDNLAGLRDKALVFTGVNYASRASEISDLRDGHVSFFPEGMKVNVVSGKTLQSIRHPKIPYAKEKAICPVRSYRNWREELGRRDPTDPAFHSIDRHGNVGHGLRPGGVTEAIARIAAYSGIELRWTGHSLRAGLATIARRAGKTIEQIAAQGGWSPTSRKLFSYLREVDGWTDSAAAGLA